MAMNKVDIDGYNSYGIYAVINNNYYIIYADNNGDSMYHSSDRIIETINLLNNVKINNTLDVFLNLLIPKHILMVICLLDYQEQLPWGLTGLLKQK